MSQKMKIVAAKEAVKYVKNNMKLGLGTGSTVDEFLKLLSTEVKNGLDISGVVTSEKTKVLSESLGIILAPLYFETSLRPSYMDGNYSNSERKQMVAK